MPGRLNEDREKLEAIREQMPATKSCYYLNTGTNGPLPKVTVDIMKQVIDKEFTEGRYLPFIKELYADMDKTRALLAGIVGAAPEEIALTRSATEALNIVLWGLPWQSGDEAITTTVAHPAGLAPLSLVKQRYGIVVKYIDVPWGDKYKDEDVLASIERLITPRTRLLLVSHVSFSTGITFPLGKLAELCHRNNMYILVDGAQGAGAVPMNMHELGIDFYAIAGRKWLCGPEGIGALYIAKHRISEVDPTFISPSSIRNRHDLDIQSPYVIPAPFAARYHLATAMNSAVLLGFQKSLEFLYDLGLDWITERVPALARYVRGLLAKIPEVEFVTPPNNEAGFVHFHVKGWKPSDLCGIMNEKKFMIRPVPKEHLPAPARISTGFYNTKEELDLLVEALSEVIRGSAES
jgi:L-cysteine/cystine lyase